MGRNYVKTLTGWIIIIGHFLIIILILLYLDPYLNSAQKMQVILTLSPVTAAYFVSVVTGFIAGQLEFGGGVRVNLNFTIVSILLPFVLICFVLYLILRYPSSIAGDVSSLQSWIAAAEVALGGTVGLIVNDLFPKASSSRGE